LQDDIDKSACAIDAVSRIHDLRILQADIAGIDSLDQRSDSGAVFYLSGLLETAVAHVGHGDGGVSLTLKLASDSSVAAMHGPGMMAAPGRIRIHLNDGLTWRPARSASSCSPRLAEPSFDLKGLRPRRPISAVPHELPHGPM